MPTGSGSLLFNYTYLFLVLLLALVDADYWFIAVVVGSVGKSSNCKDFKNSNIGRKLESNELGIPGNRPLPSDDNGKCMQFVIVVDEDFPLPEHVLRPYPNGRLSVQQRIYNYRLKRVRRMVDYAFGILANKWRIFRRSFDVTSQFWDSIIQACCIQHNFVRRNDGFQLEDNLYESNFESIQFTGTRGNTKSKDMRDYFAKYSASPHGTVTWQRDKVWFGDWHILKKYLLVLNNTRYHSW
jgi:hypothetical protein